MKHKKTDLIYGIGVSILLAIPAYFLGRQYEIIGGSVFAILIGMLIATKKTPEILAGGIQFTSKKILQYSIVMIGFGMNLNAILVVGSQSLLIMVFTISASLLTAFFMGKLLHIKDNTRILIGVGTSICGGSAIAATAPVIDADDQEIAFSISTIFLFNIIAVFLFPPLGRALGLSDSGFGMWAGTAINDTSSVVAAGYTFSNIAGDYATIVKLTRTLMIIPITLFLALHKIRKGKNSSVPSKYRFHKIFPWFVLGFLFTAMINSIGILPVSLTSFCNFAGKFGIIVAMAAIGLNTNLKKLILNGFRPILLGLSCWAVVALVSLAVQKAIGLL